MVWPWTLTFWPKNVIRLSVFQDAPVTKVGRKSINRYWRYSGNMKIWDAFGHAVTLTFDLLTPKSNQFISVRRCISDESLAKIRQQILEISRKHKTTTWITDVRTDGRTTRKHIASAGDIASAGAYRRRRLKKLIQAADSKRWNSLSACLSQMDFGYKLFTWCKSFCSGWRSRCTVSLLNLFLSKCSYLLTYILSSVWVTTDSSF